MRATSCSPIKSLTTSSASGHGDVATVDLQRRTCTCKIFDLEKIPCPHSMAAIRSQQGDDFGN